MGHTKKLNNNVLVSPNTSNHAGEYKKAEETRRRCRRDDGEASSSSSKADDQPITTIEPWQTTSLCLGPSINTGAGWGVFACRDFKKGDVVEIAPMFLRFEERPKVLKETILNDYHYEYWSWNGVNHDLGCMLPYGLTMYYNHGPSPNIEYRKWGIGPDIDNMDNAVAVGFYALRDIHAGEELINDYGGNEWFEERGYKLLKAKNDTMTLHQEELKVYATKYQSKLYSGYGISTYQKVLDWYCRDQEGEEEEEDSSEDETSCCPYNLESIAPLLPTNHKNVGYGSVIAKQSAKPGDKLEFAPALALKKSYVSETLLESIVINWSDLHFMKNVVDDNTSTTTTKVRIQYQEDSEDEVFQPSQTLEAPLEDTVLLPLAGTVGLLRRSKTNPNVEIRVSRDEYNQNGFCLHVVALETIEVGGQIIVDLPEVNTERIQAELACTGQAILYT